MRTSFAPLLAVALSAAFLGFAAPASAGIVDSCGRIELSASAQCEMRVEGGCTASCQPVNFTAQCSAELYVGCGGECNVMIDASCTASCSATCEADCAVDPGKFDCAAACRADCSGSCDATCVGAKNTAECRSSCSATCAGDCDARCDATPPSADCKAQCASCCTGSCEAEANMSCQVDCQAKGYVGCTTDLQGGCETACTRPDGALFCDGQYIDAGDQLDQCVADLKSLFQIEVKGYAYGDAQCSNGECTAEGAAGFSCAQDAGAGQSSSSAAGILGALAAFGLAFSRRKNQPRT
jgi:hypothetical protein